MIELLLLLPATVADSMQTTHTSFQCYTHRAGGEILTMSQSLQSVLEAARQLPPDELRQLVERLLQEVGSTATSTPEESRKQRARSIVEETYGSIKGLDRATLISLAEDEEYCGY